MILVPDQSLTCHLPILGPLGWFPGAPLSAPAQQLFQSLTLPPALSHRLPLNHIVHRTKCFVDEKALEGQTQEIKETVSSKKIILGHGFLQFHCFGF